MYRIFSWSGDFASNATTITVTMNKPVKLQANWIMQYYVTIISPTGSPSGEGWYNAGSVVTVRVQSTVQYSNGTRMVFNGWNSTSLGNSPTAQIMVNSPTRLLAAWKTQYLVTVQSQYGTPLGAGWYDLGSTAPISIEPQVTYSNATRRTFARAKWNTEYLVTFTVNGVPNSTILKLNVNNAYYDLSATSSYQTWVEKGTSINPTLNQTIANGIMTYKFTGWRNSTGSIVQSPLSVNAPGTYIASYNTELSLPPIPGFPVEGTLLGVLFGSLLLAIKRKHKRGGSKSRRP